MVAGTVACLAAPACLAQDRDRRLIDQFFAASRLRDRTALARFATVVFEPARDGIVEAFDIIARTPEGDVSIRARVRLASGVSEERAFVVSIRPAPDPSERTLPRMVTAVRRVPAGGAE